MKGILLVAICIALLFAGCVEKKDSIDKDSTTPAGSADKVTDKIIVTITSPKAGEILQGNKDVSFDSMVKGGQGPYTYKWTSNIDGVLSTSTSFRQNPSKLGKGGHMIVLKVTDARGNSGEGSVMIDAM
jgi:PBP1b-binding outer membrane lipoprotein LpoB